MTKLNVAALEKKVSRVPEPMRSAPVKCTVPVGSACPVRFCSLLTRNGREFLSTAAIVTGSGERGRCRRSRQRTKTPPGPARQRHVAAWVVRASTQEGSSLLVVTHKPAALLQSMFSWFPYNFWTTALSTAPKTGQINFEHRQVTWLV